MYLRVTFSLHMQPIFVSSLIHLCSLMYADIRKAVAQAVVDKQQLVAYR